MNSFLSSGLPFLQWRLVISKLSSTSSLWVGSFYILLYWILICENKTFLTMFAIVCTILANSIILRLWFFINPLLQLKSGIQKMNYEFLDRVRLGTRLRMFQSMSATLKEEQMYFSLGRKNFRKSTFCSSKSLWILAIEKNTENYICASLNMLFSLCWFTVLTYSISITWVPTMCQVLHLYL